MTSMIDSAISRTRTTLSLMAVVIVAGLIARAPCAVTKGVCRFLHCVTDHLFGSFDRATQHPHSIGKQLAITRIGYVGLNHGTVGPQFAPSGDFEFPGKLIHALVEGLQRLGLDQQCPAVEGRMIRHCVEV